jgi:hypothetical protein
MELNAVEVPSYVTKRVWVYGGMIVSQNAGVNISWVVPWYACFLGSL